MGHSKKTHPKSTEPAWLKDLICWHYDCEYAVRDSSVSCILYFLLTACNKSNQLSDSRGGYLTCRQTDWIIVSSSVSFSLLYSHHYDPVNQFIHKSEGEKQMHFPCFLFLLCIWCLGFCQKYVKKIFKRALCKNLLTKYEGITVS